MSITKPKAAILAIQPATAQPSVAYFDMETRQCIEIAVKEGKADFIPHAVQELLTQAGVEYNNINMLAICRGPGSFTGVRVGLAAVEGLVAALNIPTLSCTTFELAFADDLLAGNGVRLTYVPLRSAPLMVDISPPKVYGLAQGAVERGLSETEILSGLNGKLSAIALAQFIAQTQAWPGRESRVPYYLTPLSYKTLEEQKRA